MYLVCLMIFKMFSRDTVSFGGGTFIIYDNFIFQHDLKPFLPIIEVKVSFSLHFIQGIRYFEVVCSFILINSSMGYAYLGGYIYLEVQSTLDMIAYAWSFHKNGTNSVQSCGRCSLNTAKRYFGVEFTSIMNQQLTSNMKLDHSCLVFTSLKFFETHILR